MPYINLIQEQRSFARKSEMRTRACFFAFVGIAFVSVGAYGSLYLQSADLASQEAKLQAELQQLEPIKKKIEENQKVQNELQPRLTSLEDAQKLTDRWIHILNHLTTQTPSNVWLTNMRSAGTDQNKPVSVTVNGMSTSQTNVGEFMMRAQNESNLDNVTLNRTEEKPTVAGPAIEFEIVADVKGTAPEKLKDEEEKK
jgi:Tfp pilus assembly protein PilN